MNRKTVIKVVAIVSLGCIALVGQVGYRWYQYVTQATSPYDEVGIDLNSRMPSFMNKWGCDQLKARFGRQLPPYGCQATDGNGRQWR